MRATHSARVRFNHAFLFTVRANIFFQTSSRKGHGTTILTRTVSTWLGEGRALHQLSAVAVARGAWLLTRLGSEKHKFFQKNTNFYLQHLGMKNKLIYVYVLFSTLVIYLLMEA